MSGGGGMIVVQTQIQVWLLMACIVVLSVWVWVLARQVKQIRNLLAGEIVLDEAAETIGRSDGPYDGECQWAPTGEHEYVYRFSPTGDGHSFLCRHCNAPKRVEGQEL